MKKTGNNLIRYNLILKSILVFCFLMISLALVYFLVIFLPLNNKIERLGDSKKEILLNACLDSAYQDYVQDCTKNEKSCLTADNVCNNPQATERLCSMAKLTCESKCKPTEDNLKEYRDICFKKYK